MQQYRVNFGLLIGLIIGTLVVSAATYGLHRFQLDRNADTLIASGEKSQEKGDLKTAVREYSNYLSVRPDDTKIYLKLANLWADIVEQPKFDPEDLGRAIGILEEVVRQMPEEKALQRRLVDLYGRFGQIQQALDHLARMLEKFPDDAELHVKQVEYLLRARKFDGPDGALAKCKKLIGYDDKTDAFDAKKAIAPHDPSAYSNCGGLLRSVQDKPELAGRVMDQLIKENPELPAAYLQRGQYYISVGEPSRGQRDVDKAFQLAPEDADVLLTKAARADADKRTDQARNYLETGKKVHPEDARFYQGLASLLVKDQEYKQALQIVDDGLKVVPGDAAQNLLFFKSELQFMANDISGVRLTAEDMRKAGFGDVFIDWIEARILLIQNRYYEAGEALAKLQPKMGDGGPYADQIAMQLGLAYEKSAQLDKAHSAYQSVLQRNPKNDPAKAGLQRVAMMRGRPEKDPKTDDLDEQIANILQQPKAERDWIKVDAELAKLVEERKYEGATLDLFWARTLLAREEGTGRVPDGRRLPLASGASRGISPPSPPGGLQREQSEDPTEQRPRQHHEHQPPDLLEHFHWFLR